jgi:hypothetical protein
VAFRHGQVDCNLLCILVAASGHLIPTVDTPRLRAGITWWRYWLGLALANIGPNH